MHETNSPETNSPGGGERRRLPALFLVLFGVSSWLAAGGEGAAQDNGNRRAGIVEVKGTITPLTEHMLLRKLEVARDRGVDLLIVEIDSPGGFVDSSFNIAHTFRDLDFADTVAWIPREALSGAAIVALGCDQIAISERAVMGDAGPIFQGEDSLFRHAPEKIRSDIARKIRDLAEATGRPPALAEAMVDMDLVVFEVRNQRTGQTAFLSDAEIEASDDPGDWEKVRPVIESREARFLEVNGKRAVALGLAELNAADRDQLLEKLDAAGPPLMLTTNSLDLVVMILNSPLITGLLFVVGLIALYVEFSAPGISVGGLISALCFALFFWSRFLGGTADVLEVVLFVLGVAFILIEMFVIPGFGVAGIAGVLLMMISLVLAGQDFLVPSTGRQLMTFSTSLLVVTCSIAAFLFAAAFMTRHFGALPIFNKLALQPPRSADDDPPPEFDKDGKPVARKRSPNSLGVGVGDWGTTVSPLRPAGKVRFGDQFLDVLSDSSFIECNRQVRIVEVNGNRIVVRDVDED